MEKVNASFAGDVKETAINSNPSISQDGGEKGIMAEQEERTGEQTEQKIGGKGEEKGEEKENYIPYSRFKEVIAKKNEYEQKLKELEERLKQEEEQKLKEKEEYKTLYEKAKQEIEQYKSYEEKVREYEETMKELISNELEQVKKMIGDEKWNDIIELLDLENADPLTLLRKLPKIKKLAGGAVNNITGGQDIPKKESNKTEKEMLKQKIIEGKASMQEKARYMQLIKQN